MHAVRHTFGPTNPPKGGRSGPPPGTIVAEGVAVDVGVARGVDDIETLAEEAAYI